MTYTLQPFRTWADLLAYVSDPSSDSNRCLKYKAPMDLASVYVDVVRVYKNGKLRIRSGTSDPLTFTADPVHLDRFLRRIPDPTTRLDRSPIDRYRRITRPNT